MFEVRISAEAEPIIQRAIADYDGPKAGLMIHRQGPTGDITRSSNGGFQWEIERPHPWAIQIGSFDGIPDNDENIVVVGGFRIWLPLLPRSGESGVEILVREGQLHVETITA